MWINTFLPGNKNDGVPILSVLAKKTYSITPGNVKTASEQLPLVETDVYEDSQKPLYSEIAAETDLISYKLTTDVVVVGKAYTPDGKKAYYLDCSVRVGPLKKTVMVYGNRKVESKALRGLIISDPEPFTEMELGYRYAYGGIAISKDGAVNSFLPNPIGRGFTLKGGFEKYEDILIPNLEDPDFPLTPDNLILSKTDEWVNAPKPASFGWTRKNFYPRYTYAGVLPEQVPAVAEQLKTMQGGSSQIKIPKLDYRLFQGASEGLWGKVLKGDEHVTLKYFDKDYPTFEFELPSEKPVMTIDTGEGPRELCVALQTVVIDMNTRLLSVVWRGICEYGGIEELSSFKKLQYEVQ